MSPVVATHEKWMGRAKPARTIGDAPATMPAPGQGMEAVRAIDMLRWLLFGIAALVVGQAALGFLGLFATAMFPMVLRHVDHDSEGYPVERAWADEHPELFRLRYATESVRIYDVIGHGETGGGG